MIEREGIVRGYHDPPSPWRGARVVAGEREGKLWVGRNYQRAKLFVRITSQASISNNRSTLPPKRGGVVPLHRQGGEGVVGITLIALGTLNLRRWKLVSVYSCEPQKAERSFAKSLNPRSAPCRDQNSERMFGLEHWDPGAYYRVFIPRGTR